ncbi:MAG: MotA/TolQ/ExbB proton channel family protein [Candidatus Tenebribacter davisii]|jgi:biopolymer transport protein ExbB|nr:MotA/TolQ/ExbB proton channel family protein [Candidatus Tenebribacter davisii]
MDLVILAADVPVETSVFSIASKGGFLMIFLFIISITVLSLVIGKLIQLKRSHQNEEEFLQEIYGYLGENKLEIAIRICEDRENSPIANIIAKAISVLDRGMSETKEAIESAVNKEVHRLEKNLGTLATFAAVAPLIGFLGTVTGMVKVFMRLGETGGGVDISLLANGIWEALITTIGGLSVGIITILFYNYLIGRVENLSHELEENTNEFIYNIRGMKDDN